MKYYFSYYEFGKPLTEEHKQNISKALKEKYRKNKGNLEGVGYATGAALVGQQTLRSGIPRVLGVRLESHSTSRKNAESILKGGGFLDPNYGGTGASRSSGVPDFINSSKGNVYITGRHGKKHPLNTYEIVSGETGVKLVKGKSSTKASKDPLKNIIDRKFQRSIYRRMVSQNNNVPGLGFLGLKGRTLYIGGSDRYFDKNFLPDNDDVALKTSKKIKVFGSRFGATKNTLKRYGNGNYLKGASRLMGANKARVAAGLAILGGGALTTGLLADEARKSFTKKSN